MSLTNFYKFGTTNILQIVSDLFKLTEKDYDIYTLIFHHMLIFLAVGMCPMGFFLAVYSQYIFLNRRLVYCYQLFYIIYFSF